MAVPFVPLAKEEIAPQTNGVLSHVLSAVRRPIDKFINWLKREWL